MASHWKGQSWQYRPASPGRSDPAGTELLLLRGGWAGDSPLDAGPWLRKAGEDGPPMASFQWTGDAQRSRGHALDSAAHKRLRRTPTLAAVPLGLPALASPSPRDGGSPGVSGLWLGPLTSCQSLPVDCSADLGRWRASMLARTSTLSAAWGDPREHKQRTLALAARSMMLQMQSELEHPGAGEAGAEHLCSRRKALKGAALLLLQEMGAGAGDPSQELLPRGARGDAAFSSAAALDSVAPPARWARLPRILHESEEARTEGQASTARPAHEGPARPRTGPGNRRRGQNGPASNPAPAVGKKRSFAAHRDMWSPAGKSKKGCSPPLGAGVADSRAGSGASAGVQPAPTRPACGVQAKWPVLFGVPLIPERAQLHA